MSENKSEYITPTLGEMGHGPDTRTMELQPSDVPPVHSKPFTFQSPTLLELAAVHAPVPEMRSTELAADWAVKYAQALVEKLNKVQEK